MALVPRLDLRHVQTLIMTPQLQQAIKLLQLSNLELSEFIDREIEQNPLLEREDLDSGVADVDRDRDTGDDQSEGAEFADEGFDQPDSFELARSEDFSGANDAALDTEYDNVWTPDGPSDGAGGETNDLHWNLSGGGGGFDDGDNALESTQAGELSLREHLVGQINVDLHDPVDRVIALHLIDLLDGSGYLSADIGDVAAALGCAPARVEATLEKVQRFDPAGIFARNLAECLALQLRDRNRFDPAMQALVNNLDLLAKRDFTALRKLCGVESDDFAEMVAEIKALDPKPAQSFDYTVAQPVTPDVLVRRQADGWSVELNAETLPRVLVNNQYFAHISQRTSGKAEKEYIDGCYQSANWLVKALHQRAQTILRVATELVRRQNEFLNRGVQYLRPLVLRDIAEALEIHESTVSRVTNNKYMATPRGIFEMKYFFNFALGDVDNGGTHSAEAIRHRIKAMIDKESPDQVLSDDKIVDVLRKDGVDIARRTVAKYREAMQIPSSVQRRREKLLNV